MDQRNTQHPHQTHDHPLEGNTAEQVIMYMEYPNRSSFHGNHHSFQNIPTGPNLALTASPPIFSPYMMPQNNAFSINMNEFVRNNLIIGKRKNAENSNSSTSFSYQPNFEYPESQGSGNSQLVEGSHGIMRRSFNVISQHPETAYFYHHPSYVVQSTHMGYSMHPASNVWMPLLSTENNINPMTHPHGRQINSEALELPNIGVPAFSEASSSAHATLIYNPPSLPNFHLHPLPLPTMQLQNYGHPIQMQAPFYPHPLNNMHPVHLNLNASRLPQFLPNPELIYTHRHMHQWAPVFTNGSVILSPEDAAVMDRLYGAGNTIDQHQDMRYDTDGMTYEQLLDLGEQIGVVNTGLTEEYIMNHLKTSALSSISQETEVCSICQEGFATDMITGTLDCGHNYHKDCIKEWLLMKNLCPICKKTALATSREE